MERVMTTELRALSLSTPQTMVNGRRSRFAFRLPGKYLSKTTVGWIAIGVGVFTAMTPAWVATTRAAYPNHRHEIFGNQAGLAPEKVEALIAGLPTSFDDP